MRHDPKSYRLPVSYHDSPFIAPRARTRRRLTGKRGNQVVTGNRRNKNGRQKRKLGTSPKENSPDGDGNNHVPGESLFINAQIRWAKGGEARNHNDNKGLATLAARRKVLIRPRRKGGNHATQ